MPTRARSEPWTTRAAAVAAAIPRERLHPDVLAWAEAAPRRAAWGVGFSGGADSLALALLLWAHWPERRARLRLLHFDHRLRGAESRRDAVFCRAVARALRVEFVSAAWQRPSAAPIPGEAAAREARLAFFRKYSRALWLGHQQDDIAESMLMRLARGSGAGGLAAPRPVQTWDPGRVHLRPLLTLQKAEIETVLRGADVPWREDASNAGGRYFRNRIRRDVLPAWIAASQRDAVAGAARSRMLLDEDDAALERRVDELAPVAGGELVLDRLAGQPRAVVRRALHRWLQTQPQAGALSSQAFAALLAMTEAGRATRQSLGRAGFAVIRAGRVRFERSRKPRG